MPAHLLPQIQLVSDLTVPHSPGQTLIYCSANWLAREATARTLSLPLFHYDRAFLFGETEVKAIGLWVPSNGTGADFNARRECVWVHTPTQAEAEDTLNRSDEINDAYASLERGEPVPSNLVLPYPGFVAELRTPGMSVFLAYIDEQATLDQTLKLAQQGVRPDLAEVLSAPERLIFPSVHIAAPGAGQSQNVTLKIDADSSAPPSHPQSTGHLLPGRAFHVNTPFLVWVGGAGNDVPFCAWIADPTALDPWNSVISVPPG
ncbi:MAG: hypothetical protein IPK82_29850 [Polyangiaceae bacterium]|nr:hypothetical protein [Polyangiaceae bacterium]